MLVSAGKDSVQSSTSGELVSALAVDGNTSSAYGSCTTTLSQGAQYWQVDLGDNYQIANVTVINRYCMLASIFIPISPSVSVPHVPGKQSAITASISIIMNHDNSKHDNIQQ